MAITKVIDGDSLRLIRTRTIGEADGLRIDATDTAPVAVRLVHLDTPERGEDGWAQAHDDLADWIYARPMYARPLVLHVAGRDNFGRILGDLRTPDGDSATLHMIRDKGWSVWEDKR